MSVVVAIKHNGKIYMGCDSQSTCGDTRSTLKNSNNYKIWKVNDVDHCLMGSVGTLRDACSVRTMHCMIDELDVLYNRIGFEYVFNTIVPSIITRLRQTSFLKNDDYFEFMDSSFLFAYKDKLFSIGCDGAVIEIEDCVAIGSGKNVAIGSLLSTIGEDPVTRIITAIKASAAKDIYVDYPIIITDSDKTEFSIITEKNEKSHLKGDKAN